MILIHPNVIDVIHAGLIVTFHNVFDAPDDATYQELAKVARKSKTFKVIQKTGPTNNRKNRRFMSVADFVETSNRKRGTGSQLRELWYPSELVALVRALFKEDPTINLGWILHVAPLHVQGVHQDDKLQAKRIEESTSQDLLGVPFEDLHWAIFGALSDGQFLRVALGGNPTEVTPYPLRKGSITFMLTNTWHEGDDHTSDTPSLKIFVDSAGQPADSNRQRYFGVNSRQTSDDDRQEIIANAASPHIVEVEL